MSKRHTREEAERVVMKMGGTLKEMPPYHDPMGRHVFFAIAPEGESWNSCFRDTIRIQFYNSEAPDAWKRFREELATCRELKAVMEGIDDGD